MLCRSLGVETWLPFGRLHSPSAFPTDSPSAAFTVCLLLDRWPSFISNTAAINSRVMNSTKNDNAPLFVQDKCLVGFANNQWPPLLIHIEMAV